jgi:hypothetical protein
MGTANQLDGRSGRQDATDLRRLATFVRERRQAIAAGGRATDAADQLLHKLECVLLQLAHLAPTGAPDTHP